MQFTIVFSNKCNLTCDYCCVYDSLNKGSQITVQDAYNFLEWQLSLYPKNEEHIIEFFGGEPTIHYKEIKELFQLLEQNYSDYNLSYRIYTNGIYNTNIKNDRDFWLKFDDIIVSIDGTYEENLHRTSNQKAYNTSISNLKDLLEYAKVGIAFVLHPNSNLDNSFKYFKEMGVRYFHFEIASLWNDDKNNNITLNYLYKVFNFIYENVLLHNINNINNYYLFSIPREFLSPENFFKNDKKISCLDTMRSLSPEGNIYFCRDLAVSEFHLKSLSTDSNTFFRSNSTNNFNIKNLQLDKNTNNYNELARNYDKLTACPVKSFEFIHLSNMKNPIWIEDKDFQDLLIYPLFEIMNDTFYMYHHQSHDNNDFMDNYKLKIETYGYLLNELRKLY